MAKQDFYEFFLPSVIPDRKAAAGAVAAGSIAGFLLVFTTIKAPFDGRAPAIYVADPWSPTSEAVVEWSHEKGGIPWGRKPLLFYLITVREALQFFGADYDDR